MLLWDLAVAHLGVTPLAMRWGCGCLGAQLALYGLFAHALPAGPWTKLPGLTAHQAICFPLMLYLAVVGVQAWLLAPPEIAGYGATARSRVLEEHPIGSVLSQIVLGELLLWDIPCSLFVADLREGLMVAHHIGMAIVASSSTRPLFSFYATFFFGAIEVSGVPLSIVDLFHPKHKHWAEYEKTAPRFAAVNEAARICFAAAYLPLRACYFPWVVAMHAIPDILEVINQIPADERPHAPDLALYGVITFGVAFSVLQIYWGVLVFKQVLKVLGVGPKSTKKA